MFRVSLKTVRARLAIGVIVLATAFVAGSLIWTALLANAFRPTTGDVNVFSTEVSEELPGVRPRPLRDLDLARVRDTAGVLRVEPIITSSAVYALDTKGQLLGQGGATNFHDAPSMDAGPGQRLIKGQVPEAVGEVAMNEMTFARSGYQLGDQIEISTPYDGTQPFKLVGLVAHEVGSQSLFFTIDDMRRIALRDEVGFTGLWVVAEPGLADEVAEAVGQVTPTGYSVATGTEIAQATQESMQAGLSYLTICLFLVTAVALVAASLLIGNTFSILVTQRAAELSLLRAMGATRRQILVSILGQAGLVGAGCATLGIGLGYALVWGILACLRNFDLHPGQPQFTWPAVLAAYGLGIGATVLAALAPARRASAIQPVAAKTSAASRQSNHSALLGIGLFELGVVSIVCAVWVPVPHPFAWLGVGALLLLLGAMLATPALAGPLISLLTWVFTRFFGEPGRIAGLNVIRQPGRTAATTATLLIGLAAVSGMAVLAESITASNQSTTAQRGDFIAHCVTGQTFDARVVQEAADVAGVAEVHPIWAGLARLDGAVVRIGGATAATVAETTGLEVTGELHPEGALVSDELAAARALQPGQLLSLHSLTGDLVELRISGTYPYDAAFGDIIVEPEAFASLSEEELVRQVVVEVENGANLDGVHTALVALAAPRPTVEVVEFAQYQAGVGRFTQLFQTGYVLLGLAIALALVGLVNSLSLAVVERSPELGLLRAVGMTRSQVRLMVRLEAVVIALVGGVLGVAVGLVCGAALVHLLAGQGIDQLRVPWLVLLGLFSIVMLVGMLAAIWPGRAAGRAGGNLLRGTQVVGGL